MARIYSGCCPGNQKRFVFVFFSKQISLVLIAFFPLSFSLETSESFAKQNSLNVDLVDRLKKVKVSDENAFDEPDDETKSKLPKERFGFEFPYPFFKPEVVPPNKIAVLDILDLLKSSEDDKMSSQELAQRFALKQEDVENVLKYVRSYAAKDDKYRSIELYGKNDDSQQSPYSSQFQPPGKQHKLSEN